MNRYVIFFIFIFMAIGGVAEGGGAVAKRQKARAQVKPRIVAPPVVPPQTVSQENTPQHIEYNAERAVLNGLPQRQTAVRPEDVKEIADLSDVVVALRSSSRAWALIIDREAKETVVRQFMQDFRRAGIKINKPPPFYVQTIDAMAQGDPEMLRQPFDRLLQVAAIMEYDFDNGQNKDALAKKILGPQAFEQNKKRLGLK